MTKEDLLKLKEKLSLLSEEEKKQRDLYLRKLANGELQGPPVGYPSIDKPWLKWYEEKYLTRNISTLGIYDYIKMRNHDKKDLIAINYFGNKITFKDFFKRVDYISKAFIEMGIKSGDVVTLLLANTPENVLCMYALNSIGAIPNMVDLRQKGKKLVNSINSTDSKMVITTDLFLENLDNVADKVEVDNVIVASPFDSMPLPLKTTLKLIKKSYKPQNLSITKWKDFEKMGIFSFAQNTYCSSADDIACIVHTSGTTGISKGVALTNKNFNAMVAEYEDVIVKVKRGDKILCQVPPFLAYSAIMDLHLPLSLGVTLEMLPDYEPSKFADNIYKHKTQHAVAGPADWSNFLNNDKISKRDYSFLITMGSGSDKIDTVKRHQIDQVLANAGCRHCVFEGYGMTEVGSAAVTNLPYYIVDDSVGIPLSKMSIMVFDNAEKCELPYGAIGEICLSGDTLMKEYYNNFDETSKVIHKYPDGNRWIHSGDYGYINSDGNLFLKGRIKRIIVSFEGFKISPNDIEKVIIDSGMVSDCCVVGVDDLEHGRGAVPVVNIVLNESYLSEKDIVIEELFRICKSRLSEKYQPHKIIVRDELPLTDVGKVDYRSLEAICNNESIQKIKKK